jgi:polar amino acid transport system substrate-binding protein
MKMAENQYQGLRMVFTKRLSGFLICCLILSCGLLSAVPAYSQDMPKPPLKIATIPLPPWGYTLNTGEISGIAFGWANTIADRMGRKIDNRIFPMERVFKEIESGRSDFTIMLRTDASDKISVPIANVGKALRVIVWPRKGISIKSYNDLKGIRLSMARGLKVDTEFDQHKDLLITPSIDYINSMRMFKVKRIDAIVGSQQSLLFNALKSGLDPKKDFDEPFELAQLEAWILASRQFVEREGIEEIKKVSQSLIDDGTFAIIYDTHIKNLSHYVK